MLFSSRILEFLSRLELTTPLPSGVEVLNPYRDPVAFSFCERFYSKYYNDDHQRTLILGINPGRFGGGITGIPFTDPVKLQQICDIPNDLKKKAELSGDFIYQMIAASGGPQAFYKKFYFSSISPLGFTKNGKNMNYYDDRELEHAVTPFAVRSIATQLDFGMNREIAFCLGEGKNFNFLSKLNAQHGFFKQVVPLAHPRFIMQYRRKLVAEYVTGYISQMSVVKS